MSKTNPVGVRFDKAELDFIMKKESLTTVQSVVNYLLHSYYEIHNAKANAFVIMQPFTALQQGRNLTDAEIQSNMAQLPVKTKLKRSYANYHALKKDCTSNEEWEELTVEIREADNLTLKEKSYLLNTNNNEL